MRWADTFAGGGRRTIRNALMGRYVTMRWYAPSKVPLPMGDLDPQLIRGSFDPHVSPHTASRSVQPFLHSSPVCTTDTDYTTRDICSKKPHL